MEPMEFNLDEFKTQDKDQQLITLLVLCQAAMPSEVNPEGCDGQYFAEQEFYRALAEYDPVKYDPINGTGWNRHTMHAPASERLTTLRDQIQENNPRIMKPYGAGDFELLADADTNLRATMTVDATDGPVVRISSGVCNEIYVTGDQFELIAKCYNVWKAGGTPNDEG